MRNAKIYKNREYRGRSGQTHQIDVAVEFEEIGVEFRVIIECKYWSTRVSAEEVMVLAQRVADIGAQKGILVSKGGFQVGAIRMAKELAITLVRLNVDGAALGGKLGVFISPLGFLLGGPIGAAIGWLLGEIRAQPVGRTSSASYSTTLVTEQLTAAIDLSALLAQLRTEYIDTTE